MLLVAGAMEFPYVPDPLYFYIGKIHHGIRDPATIGGLQHWVDQTILHVSLSLHC